MKTLLILTLALAVPASAGAARKAKTPKAMIQSSRPVLAAFGRQTGTRAISYQWPGGPDLSGRSSGGSSGSSRNSRKSLTPRVEALERVVLQQQSQIEFLTAELKRQIEAGNAIMAKLPQQGVNLK